MAEAPENPEIARRLAAILAADIAGYSTLMGANEEATVRDLKAHQAVVLPLIGEHGGRVIDTAGDGILAEFPSAVNAVKCAMAIQKAMAERNALGDPTRRMQFRIGVNLGDVVFDEVITGFRWSRGGAQGRYGLTPDLCVLAKIVAGGLPGGAVAGRADIMDRLDPLAAKTAGQEKIGHQGTFNANPLSAAAAVATLNIVETEEVCAAAERTAAIIRDGLTRILVEEQVAWGVYGEASAFLLFQNPGKLDIDPGSFDPIRLGFAVLKGARNPNLAHRLRVAMLANGVDVMGAPGGLVSATHGLREVAQTLEAFRTAVRWLKAEGDIAN